MLKSSFNAHLYGAVLRGKTHIDPLTVYRAVRAELRIVTEVPGNGKQVIDGQHHVERLEDGVVYRYAIADVDGAEPQVRTVFDPTVGKFAVMERVAPVGAWHRGVLPFFFPAVVGRNALVAVIRHRLQAMTRGIIHTATQGVGKRGRHRWPLIGKRRAQRAVPIGVRVPDGHAVLFVDDLIVILVDKVHIARLKG